MRRFIAALGVLAIAVTARPARAQTVQIQWLYQAESIFLSDFDPYSPGRQPDLFAITIMGGTPGQNLELKVSVRQTQPDNVFIFSGETAAFTLAASTLRLTNRELTTRNGPYTIANNYTYGNAGTGSDLLVERLSDQLLQTGRFPAGTYEFEVTVCPPSPECSSGIAVAQASILRTFVNPTRVDLLGPGRPFGDIPPTVTSPSPRFLWTTDTGGLLSGIGRYRIRVARVDQDSSAEEAIQAFAVWEAVCPTDSACGGGTSAIYPGSARAIPLVAGASYAWQVTRDVQTSGGVQPLESPIFWFRMAETPGGNRAGTGNDDTAPRQIQQLAEQLGLGTQLQGFQPRGQVLVDGRPASPDALQELLRRIISGEATVLSITVR